MSSPWIIEFAPTEVSHKVEMMPNKRRPDRWSDIDVAIGSTSERLCRGITCDMNDVARCRPFCTGKYAVKAVSNISAGNSDITK